MSEEQNNSESREGKDGMEELEEALRKVFSLGLQKEEVDNNINAGIEQLNITEDPYQNPGLQAELKEFAEKMHELSQRMLAIECERVSIEIERHRLAEKLDKLKEKYNIHE